MVVRWLGYQSFFFQCQTDIPGRFSTSRLSDNSIQKSFSTHLADHRIVDLLHFTAEKDTHFESILRKMLVTHHLKGSYRYTGSQGFHVHDSLQFKLGRAVKWPQPEKARQLKI
jgi:hypothetical protein